MNTPESWQEFGCPRSHVEAWKIPKWRRALEAEREMVRLEMEAEEAWDEVVRLGREVEKAQDAYIAALRAATAGKLFSGEVFDPAKPVPKGAKRDR